MSDQRVNIEIRTKADTTGAKQTEQALGNVNRAAGTTAKQAQQTARNVNELGENFEKGASAGRVLSSAMQGNVAAIAQLGPAIKALGAAMKTNLIGALVTLGGVLAATIIPIMTGFKKKLDETEASAKRADEALQLRKDAVEKVSTAINQLATDAEAAEKQLRALQNRNDAIGDAKLGLELAQIRAREDLTDVERLDLENAARDRRANDKRANERQTNEAIIAARRGAQNAAQANVDETFGRLQEAAQQNAQLAGRRSFFEDRVREIAGRTASNPIEANANARELARAEQDLRDFETGLEAAGQQSLLLAEQFQKAKEALAKISGETAAAISEVQAQENLQQTVFDINRQTTAVTTGTERKKVAQAQEGADLGALTAERDRLAANQARLDSAASSGDFSFSGALRRSQASEAADANRAELERASSAVLMAEQRYHEANVAAQKKLAKAKEANAREIERLDSKTNNARP